jgi:hypothetical protein
MIHHGTSSRDGALRRECEKREAKERRKKARTGLNFPPVASTGLMPLVDRRDSVVPQQSVALDKPA